MKNKNHSSIVTLTALMALSPLAFADAPASLRGGTYGDLTLGSGAADNTIDDLTERPYVAFGQKLIYVEPGTSEGRKEGAVTLADGDKTWFAHARQAWHNQIRTSTAPFYPAVPEYLGNISTLTTGLALNNMGFSIFFGSDKIKNQLKTTDTTSKTTSKTNLDSTSAGNQVGLGFGMIVANNEFYGNVKYVSYDNEFVNESTSKTAQIKSNIEYLIGWRNIAQTSTSTVVDVRLHGSVVQDSTTGNGNAKNHLEFMPVINASKGITTTIAGLRPYVGTALYLPYAAYKEDTYMSAFIIPYVSVEYKLFENLSVIGAYNYTWILQHNSNKDLNSDPQINEQSSNSSYTPATLGTFGLIYNKGNLTMETKIAAQAFDGIGHIFSDDMNLFAKTSIMINY